MGLTEEPDPEASMVMVTVTGGDVVDGSDDERRDGGVRGSSRHWLRPRDRIETRAVGGELPAAVNPVNPTSQPPPSLYGAACQGPTNHCWVGHPRSGRVKGAGPAVRPAP